MNIQDRQKTLTAEGLRQRYNLDGLDNDRKSIQLIKNSINKVEIEFQNYMDIVNKSLEEYQDQVSITTWFFDDIPPIPSLVEEHLGDLYYDRQNGNAYRFEKTQNLFDVSRTDYKTGNINSSGIINETTLTNFELIDTGFIIEHSSGWRGYISGKYGLETGKQYTLSLDASLNTFYIGMYAYSQDDTYLGETGLLNNTSERQKTFTIPNNADYVRFAFECRNANQEITFSNIQIEEGTTPTEYVKYYQWIQKPKYTEVLAIENSKADTSDNKRIVFVETPTTPYTIGDVLIKNGTYYRCRAARESGEYSMNDWIIYTDYTEDMVMLDTRGMIDKLEANVETNYVSQVQLETNTQGIYATVSSTYATQTTVSTLDGEVQNTKTDVRNIDTRLSVEEGKISTLITDVGNRTGKTTSLTQDVDEIKAEISDIADITKSAERYDAYIPDSEFQDIASSTPINIEIHPIGENISYLYPNTNLYPNSNLYIKTRTLRFTNTSTNEIFDYELPEDLLYYDTNVYDTLTIDYENTKIRVLKKCAYNSNGTISTITPEEHNYDNTFSDFESDLALTQGDYSISILGYSVGYIYVRLMSLNAYTAQYATKVELHSSIRQTSEYVDVEVAKKVGNNEVIGKINLSPETATISASKINIQGLITAVNNDTTTTIDGGKITTGTITANQLSSDSVNASKIVAGTITADKIANATITGSKMVNGTITGTQIANATITGTKIANATITNSQIANATITSAKIADISADKITTGTLNAANVNITNLNASNITSGTLTGRSISGGSISGSAISGGSISISRGNYYFNMGLSTSNPNCSGLNVGNYGIKANSGITATSFAITNGDTGKSVSFQVPRQGGGWYYMTFTGGILTAWERN